MNDEIERTMARCERACERACDAPRVLETLPEGKRVLRRHFTTLAGASRKARSLGCDVLHVAASAMNTECWYVITTF